MRRVHRGQLNPAPYNPRTQDKHSRKQLRESIEADGLVETLVWNETTGNLVSGHQRLEVLDRDAGHANYLLDVAVVKLTPARERQLNVRLNNSRLAGNYDFDRLEAILADTEVAVDATMLGFDRLDLETMFPYLDLFSEPAIEEVEPEAGGEQVPATPGGTPGPGRPAPARPASLFDPKQDAALDDIQKMKDLKRKHREEAKREDSAEYYVALVFGDQGEVDRFLTTLGLPLGERYIDGRRFCSHIRDAEGREIGD